MVRLRELSVGTYAESCWVGKLRPVRCTQFLRFLLNIESSSEIIPTAFISMFHPGHRWWRTLVREKKLT